MGRTQALFTQSGREWDDDYSLNWDYFGARYYDPRIARWISRDPITEKFPDVSPYQYAHNNPINRYDVDGKADFGSAEKLKVAGMKVIANADLKPIFENGKLQQSFCNFGVCSILKAGDDETLKGMRANDIFDYLSNEQNATTLSYEEAVNYASEGVTVILATKETGRSGHVAVVAPGEMVESKSWGENVPQVFNVGRTNGLMGANLAFNKNNKPTAFILNKDKQSADARMTKKTSWEEIPLAIRRIFESWLNPDNLVRASKAANPDNARVSP